MDDLADRARVYAAEELQRTSRQRKYSNQPCDSDPAAMAEPGTSAGDHGWLYSG